MSICERINELTAWPCHTVKSMHGESIIMLAPPVSFWDGSIVPVYIFNHGGQIEITDDGGIMHHLTVSGFNLGEDKRRRKGLKNAIASWNADFDCELQVWCRPEDLAGGLQRYLAAMFAVAKWEKDNAGKSVDDEHLITEVELYLRALHPSSFVVKNAEIVGISGRANKFPLRLDHTYYDAVSSHPASSAAVIKKLFDVRSVPNNRDKAMTVVVDDRGDKKQVREDIQVFSQLAHVDRFLDLQARAQAKLVTQ